MIRLALIAATALMSLPAVAQQRPRAIPPAMQGTWGSSSESCTNATDDGRVEVKPREVTFFATYCALRRFRAARDGTITAHGLCRGEGETTIERGTVRFRRVGGNRLAIGLDDGEASTYQRCERPIPVR